MKAYRPPKTTSRPEFLKDNSDELFREAIYTMILSAERLLKCRSALARKLDLTSSQIAVLMGVSSQQKSKGVTVRDLARHVALAPTHVTTEIGRLEAMGLLVKQSNENDRRSVLVSLTTRGEHEIARVTPVVRHVNNLLFRGVSLRGLIQAHVVARELAANSGEALAYAKHATLEPAVKPRKEIRRRKVSVL